jgi:AraC-like DNA-binding protein
MKNVYPQIENSFVYTCVSEDKWTYEQFVPEHILAWQISGETHIYHQEGNYILRKDQILLAHRNQFAKTLKLPASDKEYRAVSIILKPDILKRYAAANDIDTNKRYTGKYHLIIKPSEYLESYFHSLVPYLEHPEKSNNKLVAAKLNEAIELLLLIRPSLQDFLFDFNDPHKIDLEEFMIKNFKFNTPLGNFAKLTGRSLASFKRDFLKTFNSSPAKWLKERRLSEAYYLIRQKNRKATDVYLELGFENISHFYTCFKKKYGRTPAESVIFKNGEK